MMLSVMVTTFRWAVHSPRRVDDPRRALESFQKFDVDDDEDDERHEGQRDVHRRSCRLRDVRWSIVRQLPLATPRTSLRRASPTESDPRDDIGVLLGPGRLMIFNCRPAHVWVLGWMRFLALHEAMARPILWPW